MDTMDHTWGSFTASVKINRPGTWKLTASSSAEPDKSVTLPVITMSETLEKNRQPRQYRANAGNGLHHTRAHGKS